MALDDLVPDDAGGSSSSSSSSKVSPEDNPNLKVIGKGEYRKVFDEETWEDVKLVLIQEMGLTPSEVVNNYPAEERYEVLHEAVSVANQEVSVEELGHEPERCEICGNALGDQAVTVSEHTVCVHHTVGQLAALENEED